MFNLQELYTFNQERVNPYLWLHASAMCELCRYPNKFDFTAVRNAIGFSQLTQETVVNTYMPRYVYGRDAYGQFLSIDVNPTNAWLRWRGAMGQSTANLGFTPGKTLAPLNSWADQVYATLVGIMSNTLPLTVYGVGLGGAVAFLVARKAKAALGVLTAHFLIQPPAFVTDDALENCSANTVTYSFLRDPWCYAPPSDVMNTGADSQGTLDPLFIPGTHYSTPVYRRDRRIDLNRWVVDGNPTTWANPDPRNPLNADFAFFLINHAYPAWIWNSLSVPQQNQVIPWLGFLRDNGEYLISRRAA